MAPHAYRKRLLLLAVSLLPFVLALFGLVAPLPARAAGDLRILVETSTPMPMTQIERGELVGGIHHDVGLALARQMGRTPEFELLPRKRVVMALEDGHADISCHFRPSWLTGDFDWSQPFLPNALLLVSDAAAPRAASLDDVTNVPLGTVLGFAYPEVSKALGPRFARDDAPSSANNLSKLAAGRVQYALVGEAFLHYQQASGQFKLPIHPPLLVQRYEAQCAVSRHGQVKVAEVDRAILALKRSGELRTIYAMYRQDAGPDGHAGTR
jgi:polar amino acid transport system substrate-binding protein